MMAPQGVPPGAIPNPAFAEWAKQAEAVAAIEAENAKLQAEFDAAYQLIKDDGVRGFRLDIESDSTIAPDQQAEQMARVEFLQQMIPMLQQVVPLAMGNPALAKMASEMTMFAMRGFRVARQLEESFEEGFRAIAQMPPPAKEGAAPAAPTGPDPQVEGAKLQVEAGAAQTKADTDRLAIAQKQLDSQMRAQLAREKMAADGQRDQAKFMLDAADLELRKRQMAAREALMRAQSARGLE
jgi:hypothetical protein